MERNRWVPFLPGKTQCHSCYNLPRAGIAGVRLHTWLVGLTFESEALAVWEESLVSEVLEHSVGDEKVR